MMGSTVAGAAGKSIDEIRALLSAAPKGTDATSLRAVDSTIDVAAGDILAEVTRRMNDVAAPYRPSPPSHRAIRWAAESTFNDLKGTTNASIERWVARLAERNPDVVRGSKLIPIREPMTPEQASTFLRQEFRAAELLHRVTVMPPATWTVTEGTGAQGAFDDAVRAVKEHLTPREDFASRLTDDAFMNRANVYVATGRQLPDGIWREPNERRLQDLAQLIST